MDRSHWIWEAPYYSWVNGYERLLQKGGPPGSITDVGGGAGGRDILGFRELRPALWRPGSPTSPLKEPKR